MNSHRERLFDIRGRLIVGIITYDEAKKEAEPIINELNKKGQEIAKKHKKQFHGLNFSGIMR